MFCAAKIVNLLSAESYSVGYTKSYDSNKGSQNVFEVTLVKPHIPPSYSHDKVTSGTAITIVKELTDAERSDYNKLKVIIQNTDTTYENTYDIKQLLNTIPLLDMSTSYLNYQRAQDFSKIRRLISESDINDSTLHSLVATGVHLDSTNGKVKDSYMTGFRYDHIKETNEPVIVTWLEVVYDTGILQYTFYISETAKKIIYVDIRSGQGIRD